jgi:hypothetical protein
MGKLLFSRRNLLIGTPALLLASRRALSQVPMTGAGIGAPGPGYDAATLAWISAVGTVGSTEANAVNTFITTLKGYSPDLFAKADRIWLPGSENTTQARTDLINPSGHALITAVANGGTITFTPSQGYKGDGTLSYLNLNYAPATDGVKYTLNSATIAVYNRTSNTATSQFQFGAQDSGGINATSVAGNWTAGNILSQINGGGYGSAITGGTQGVQLATRVAASGAGAQSYFITNGGGTNSVSSTNASEALTTISIFVGALNVGANFGNCADEFAIIYIGSGFTSTDNGRLATAMNAYMTALGKNVY